MVYKNCIVIQARKILAKYPPHPRDGECSGHLKSTNPLTLDERVPRKVAQGLRHQVF